MKLQHRSYSGKLFRPKPLVHETNDFTVVVTGWGSGANSSRVVEEISKYVSAALSDVEVTSHFQILAGFSDESNYLRIACMLANDSVFRNENQSEYSAGYEVLAYIHKGDQFAWAQVGGPHLLYKGAGRPVMPLVSQIDLSLQAFSQMRPAPLPSMLLGIESTCQVHCGDIRIQAQDQLVLVSASLLPSSLWREKGPVRMEVDGVTRWMAQENPEMPFWLGVLDI